MAVVLIALALVAVCPSFASPARMSAEIDSHQFLAAPVPGIVRLVAGKGMTLAFRDLTPAILSPAIISPFGDVHHWTQDDAVVRRASIVRSSHAPRAPPARISSISA